MTLTDLSTIIESEMAFGLANYGKYNSSHEHYAVLQEEVDEWWEAIKLNCDESCHYELIQVAAVALRYILENGNLETIAKAQRARHGIDKTMNQ